LDGGTDCDDQIAIEKCGLLHKETVDDYQFKLCILCKSARLLTSGTTHLFYPPKYFRKGKGRISVSFLFNLKSEI
jgi:hypothetical protein